MSGLCCPKLVGSLETKRSPFSRLVATGFYDGPTEGVAECGACGGLYGFCVVDWDDGQDVRMFELALLANCSLQTALRAGWASESTRTVWVLGSAQADVELAHAIDSLRANASVQAVLAARSLLGSPVLAWCATDLASGDDWFHRLGLHRELLNGDEEGSG